MKMMEVLAEAPEKSLPRLFEDSSELEAVYRFLGNEKVTPEKILAPHIRATTERCGTNRVIVAHDTTTVSFRAEGKRRGLGSHHRGSQHFQIHASLAVSSNREPLGVLAAETFIYDGDGGDGSNMRRWFEQAQQVEQLAGMRAELVHVKDREADDFRTLVDLQKHKYRFVIRAGVERALAVTSREVPSNVGEALKRAPIAAVREVPITARKKQNVPPRLRKKASPRNARIAQLEISAMTLELKRPTYQFDQLLPDACEVNVVRVFEPNPPEGEAPIEWILFTNEPIDEPDHILAIVDAYRARWRIEELFKALKTGCALEKRQLESFESLSNAAATHLPVAWRLLHLRSQATETPDAPASILLDADELEVLRARSRRPLSQRPTQREVVFAIAALGGHLKRNGDPGWQTLGAGLQKLLTLVEGYRLARPARRKAKTRAGANCDQS